MYFYSLVFVDLIITLILAYLVFKEFKSIWNRISDLESQLSDLESQPNGPTRYE